jgi:hypothetical protein
MAFLAQAAHTYPDTRRGTWNRLPLDAIMVSEITCPENRRQLDSARRQHLGADAFAVNNRKRSPDRFPVLADPIDGLQDRAALSDNIVNNEDFRLVMNVTIDPLHRPVRLGFLANKERVDRSALEVAHRRDGRGDRCSAKL